MADCKVSFYTEVCIQILHTAMLSLPIELNFMYCNLFFCIIENTHTPHYRYLILETLNSLKEKITCLFAFKLLLADISISQVVVEEYQDLASLQPVADSNQPETIIGGMIGGQAISWVVTETIKLIFLSLTVQLQNNILCIQVNNNSDNYAWKLASYVAQYRFRILYWLINTT